MFPVNLPNSITLTRICSIPLLIWILSTNRFESIGGEKELLASALFIAASITDGIDGYLARKRGQITTMGVLLDPLADKLLIAAAFITLPLTGFTVLGPSATRDAARIDLGSKVAVGRNTALFASFDGELSSRGQMYAGRGGLKATW